MAMQDFNVYIRLREGDDIMLDLHQDHESAVNAIARFEQLMASNMIPFEVDGKLLLVATRNILEVEISPAPDRLPMMVVRSATRA